MFQDTLLHHVSLMPWVGRWSHYLLLKENITDSQGYVGGVMVKSHLHVQMRGYLQPRVKLTLVAVRLS